MLLFIFCCVIGRNSKENLPRFTRWLRKTVCARKHPQTETIDAKCTKHNLLYIGQSSQKLNCRFNGHRSDVRVKPKACELTQHFSQSKNCKIDNNLRVYILQDNLDNSSSERMEYFEDRWITCLDTKAPNGMNTKLNDFAKTFYQLF